MNKPFKIEATEAKKDDGKLQPWAKKTFSELSKTEKERIMGFELKCRILSTNDDSKVREIF